MVLGQEYSFGSPCPLGNMGWSSTSFGCDLSKGLVLAVKSTGDFFGAER
jgi:hypothetical protein